MNTKRVRQRGTSKTTEPSPLARVLEHHRQGRSSQALQLCRELSHQIPNNAEVWSLLGALELGAGRPAEAISALNVAIERVPGSARNLVNLGIAHGRMGDLATAAELLEKALAAQPGWLEAIYNLGLVRLDLGELDAAIELLSRVHTMNPALPARRVLAKAYARRAAVIAKSNHEEAISAFQQSLLLDPSMASAERGLATALLVAGELTEALRALERALALDPTLAGVESTRVYYSAFSPEFQADDISRCARQYAQRHLSKQLAPRAPHPNDRAPDRRLRIGYVSADFRDHALRLFITPILRNHDRERFEVYCYSSEKQPDAWTARLQAYSDVWHDVAPLDDAALTDQVRADQIDLLIDLSMHMEGHRLGVFAQKPAPVQICWLAYPGTTGLEAMDYRITDPILDPPGAPLPYVESSLRMPHAFWCYEPESEEPPVNMLPALSKGHITFGCLNNFLKLNSEVFELFARVLVAVPDSQLVLLAPSKRAQERSRREFERHGISPERVQFQGLKWRADYLASYHRIDIALDSFPYNGHTTSFDACWMGVPVVTLVGQTVVGRAGLCQAHHLGLRELVAEHPDDYVRIARELAQDLPRLAELRGSLRDRLAASPFMDGARFTRDLEHLYREAWQTYCRTSIEAAEGRSSPS